MADGTGRSGWRRSADLHCRQDQHGRFRELVKMVNGEAEGLVLAGDLTDHGTLDEAKTLAEALVAPARAVRRGAREPRLRGRASWRRSSASWARRRSQVLDGDHAVFDKRLGIAGVKGFAGGFERGMLQAFGEPSIKAFVQEAVNEALKLEAALGSSTCR